MTVALIIWAYALIGGSVGVAVLRRARWVDRSPRLGIAAWRALCASVIVAVASGGLAIAMPTPEISANLAHLLDACAMALRAQYASPGGAALASGGLVLAAAVLGRWVWCTVAELYRNAKLRRRHRETLAVIGRVGRTPEVTLLDDVRPLVYCLAGRRHRIVVTSAADDALDAALLAAVLAHERAHLRGRHHVVVAAAAARTRAFPGLPIFRHAEAEIVRLVELVADDDASRATHRLSLAEAMLTISSVAAPIGALAVGGSGAAARIRRLIEGARPLAAWARVLGLAAAVVIAVAPMVALAAPAVLAGTECCSVGQESVVASDRCGLMAGHEDCAASFGTGE